MGEVVGSRCTGCAILIPSLNRPQRLQATIEAIHANTSEPHTIMFCVSDPESRDILDAAGEWYLDDSDVEDRRYVTRMNKLVRYLDGAETIFYGSDDVIHHPGWLTNALKVMETGPDVVVVNDLHNARGTQALMRRSYLSNAVFDAPGDAFHDGYLHNFADNEQHFTAYMHRTYERAMDSVVEHLHPIFRASNSITWDETYTHAMEGWQHDEALFQSRGPLIERAINAPVAV
jgi:hypothetical protein